MPAAFVPGLDPDLADGVGVPNRDAEIQHPDQREEYVLHVRPSSVAAHVAHVTIAISPGGEYVAGASVASGRHFLHEGHAVRPWRMALCFLTCCGALREVRPCRGHDDELPGQDSNLDKESQNLLPACSLACGICGVFATNHDFSGGSVNAPLVASRLLAACFGHPGRPFVYLLFIGLHINHRFSRLTRCLLEQVDLNRPGCSAHGCRERRP